MSAKCPTCGLGQNVSAPRLKWTHEWPTKPGLYLFYGGQKRPDVPDKLLGQYEFKPKLSTCEVWVTGNERLTYVAGGQFLFKSEQYGVFAPFEIELPELESEP